PPLPSRLELVPGKGPVGYATKWSRGSAFDLSAPILDFTTQDLLDDRFVAQAKGVLRFWVEDIDAENLRRLRAGVRNFTLPSQYLTGKCGTSSGWAVQGVSVAGGNDVDRAIDLLKEQLDWVSDQLCKGGDILSGVRGMLLLQQLYSDDHPNPICLSNHAER